MTPPDAGIGVLSAQVYAELRAMIIDGRLPAGSPLSERELAAELQVSRVPVREAMPALEVAGFVKVLPRRSAVVTYVTERDCHELYDLRSVLEPLVARGAAAAVRDGRPPTALVEALDHAEQALAEADVTGFSTGSANFHRAIEALAGNQLYVATMGPLRDRSERLNQITLVSDPPQRHAEHRQLRDAIASGQVEVASALAFAHVEAGRRRTLEVLTELPGFRAEP